MASIVDRHATETGKQGGKRWQVRWRDDRNPDTIRKNPKDAKHRGENPDPGKKSTDNLILWCDGQGAEGKKNYHRH